MVEPEANAGVEAPTAFAAAKSSFAGGFDQQVEPALLALFASTAIR